jgi:heterodisulfide reductase subunit D
MNAALAESSNPYGKDNKQKGDWLSELDFKIKPVAPGGSDLLYFVGCTAALTPEVRPVAVSTARVLHALGVNFTVLGGKEVCCGSVALRTGNRRVFEIVASKNSDLIKSAGIKTIITSCAGCYRTLKLDYAEILKDLDVKILHTAEYIAGLIKEKGIQLPRLDKVVTYHDPCHAGRHLGLYEPPREILKQIATLKEMKSIKENAKCCGAGGGVKKAFPELALKIAKSRLKEAEETGAGIIVSICPFCERGLNDAIKATNSKMQVVDLLELVLQSLSSTSKVAVQEK